MDEQTKKLKRTGLKANIKDLEYYLTQTREQLLKAKRELKKFNKSNG